MVRITVQLKKDCLNIVPRGKVSTFNKAHAIWRVVDFYKEKNTVLEP